MSESAIEAKKPVVLSIDDEPANQRLILAALKSDFDVLLASSGSEGLAFLDQQCPDLVLLDVNMPGQDGYEVGRIIRTRYSEQELPIIFVSAQTTLEYRIKGYESGGCDYICKPVDIAELILKLNVLLTHKKHLKEAKEILDNTQKTMFSAMGYGSELGIVIQFLEGSFNCSNFKSLGDTIFSACEGLDLSASVQFRPPNGVENYSSVGSLSPLELALLDSSSESARIISSKTKSMYNSSLVSILIKNMPVDNDELCGRIRDHLALILKGCEAQCESIINKIKEKSSRNNKVEEVIEAVFGDLTELERLFNSYCVDVDISYEDFRIDFEETISIAGINGEHSVMLMESVDKLISGTHSLAKSKTTVSDAIEHISSVVENLKE